MTACYVGDTSKWSERNTMGLVHQIIFFAVLIVGRQGGIIESKSTPSWKTSAGSQKEPKKSGSSAGKVPRKSRPKPPCARSLPKKYINDDYCDCVVDGSDEPGTRPKLSLLHVLCL